MTEQTNTETGAAAEQSSGAGAPPPAEQTGATGAEQGGNASAAAQPPVVQPAQSEQQQSGDVFPVTLIRRPTGAVHSVTGQTGMQPITDADGNPEQEYALVATIDGVQVTLDTFNAGRVDTLAAGLRAQSQQQPEQ